MSIPDGTVAEPPRHPRATPAFVLGVISVAGVVLVLPTVLGPIAAYLAMSAQVSIDRDPGRWSGQQRATHALVLGIVGSVLLVGVVILVAVGVLGTAILRHDDGGY